VPKTIQLDDMSTDALWDLYADVRKVLTVKTTDQQRDIERRLRDLRHADAPSLVPSGEREQLAVTTKAKRPYPKVLPNYRNSANPSETWSGRGNKPRWLSAQIASGKKLEEFRIMRRSGSKRG
jgi:DNA-binding protein H-NS